MQTKQPQTISLLNELLDAGCNVLYTQAACMAAQQGETVYTHTVKCLPTAMFDLASLSKLVTTTYILQLVAQGDLQLDTTLLIGLQASAKDCAAMGAVTKARLGQITVRAALQHNSGLPAWYPFYSGTDFWHTLEHALAAEPVAVGTVYSDINFILLGLVAQAVSGKTMPALLLKLNGLLGTQFCYNPPLPAACVATEYGNAVEANMCEKLGLAYLPLPGRPAWRKGQQQIQGQPNDGNAYYAFGGVSGHAGVFGTAADVLRLGCMYLQSIQGEGLLPAQLAQAAVQDNGAGRGLGFETGGIFLHGAGHTGFTGTALWVCPVKQLAGVLLASRLPLAGPPNMQPIRKQVFTLLHKYF